MQNTQEIAQEYIRCFPSGDNGLILLAGQTTNNLERLFKVVIENDAFDKIQPGIKTLKSIKLTRTKSSLRQPMKVEIEAFSKKLKESVSYVEAYIVKKYGKGHSKEYYASFGIVRTPKGYVLPGTLFEKRDGILQMIKGIEIHEFSDKKYGTQHWQQLLPSIDALIEKQTRLETADYEQEKARLQAHADIVEGLSALIEELITKFPKHYAEILTALGFTKQKTE
jgi:hypothetical protein